MWQPKEGLKRAIPVDTVFLTSSAEGKAILATDNGKGVAWLLATHKKKLGLEPKTIRQVTVFSFNDAPTHNLIFTIAPLSL